MQGYMQAFRGLWGQAARSALHSLALLKQKRVECSQILRRQSPALGVQLRVRVHEVTATVPLVDSSLKAAGQPGQQGALQRASSLPAAAAATRRQLRPRRSSCSKGENWDIQ